MRLKDKVAVVTGGGRGIGRAICERLALEGAVSVVADLDGGEADRTAAAIEAAGGNAFGIALDVTRQTDIDAALETVVTRAGRVDVLVNNAGVFDLAPLLEQTRESWDRIHDVNVTGLFFMLQAAARQMVAQGEGGRIINLASQAGRRGEALVANYCASKAAVISITQSAALALAEHDITVNAIAPGIIETPMWSVVDQLFARYQGLPPGEPKRRAVEVIPAGRIGEPEDVAAAIAFLASGDAAYITAQTLNVDGGNVMS